MFFKDWRLLDQSPVGLPFEKEYIYYVHSRAWALTGWLGGTHSWLVFWSSDHNKWFGTVPRIHDRALNTVKYSDIENACQDYPFKEFDLLKRNCNTFASYIINKLNLNITPPLAHGVGNFGKTK
jgi:hypothetical protein